MQHDDKTTPGGSGEAAAPQPVPAAGEAPAAAGAAAQPASETKPEQAAAGEAGGLGAEVEKLKGQIADLTDRLLRAHAEMDNLRKRTEREKADTAKYAITKFAGDVVNVADNFDRAIQSVPAAAAAENAALKSLLDGVTMTEREFIHVLERHGVKRLDPKGEPFNPHFHQAVMEMQNAEVAAGTVLQVYQCGYLIDERVLRPAMVVVAKGGIKSVKPADAPPPAGDAAPRSANGAAGAGQSAPGDAAASGDNTQSSGG